MKQHTHGKHNSTVHKWGEGAHASCFFKQQKTKLGSVAHSGPKSEGENRPFEKKKEKTGQHTEANARQSN